ncbi:serine/arginine-rich splicing factor 9-like isoform 2-T3 [Pholidichthys leucotaenia]
MSNNRIYMGNRIYVGNLPNDVHERHIEDLFSKYGKIHEIQLKNKGGIVPFAFIRFEDSRDANDAISGRNGYPYKNCKLRVEYPKAPGGQSGTPGGSSAISTTTAEPGRIYVGNLPTDVHERDIEDLFFKYGKIREIELKNMSGVIPFAFIRFEDPRDAHDAISGRNGYPYKDCKLRVEHPKSTSAKPQTGVPRGKFGTPTRRSDFRVVVSGLPTSASWQDLKDHMREAGDVCFTDVQRGGTGIVEFLRRDDMEFAIRRLDRTEFRTHQGDSAIVRVYMDRGGTSQWGRSRSRSRSRGRYSPPYYSRSSPPSRLQSAQRYPMSRHSSPPPRRNPPPQYSPPPPRHYR